MCIEGLTLDDNGHKIQALWVSEFQFVLGERGQTKNLSTLTPIS